MQLYRRYVRVYFDEPVERGQNIYPVSDWMPEEELECTEWAKKIKEPYSLLFIKQEYRPYNK